MSFQTTTQSEMDRPTTSRRWLLWPLVVLVPHLLYLLQAAFVAMLSMYVAWPATMGPLALLYAYMWQKTLILNSPPGWLIALGLAGAWSGAVLLVGQKWRVAAWLIYLLSFLVTALLLWRVVIPPT